MTSIGVASLDLRLRLHESEYERMGFSLRLGSMAAQAGWYLSFAAGEKVWIYAHPSVGLSFYAPVEVPIGLSIDLGNDWALNTELGVGFDPFEYANWEAAASLGYADRNVAGWGSVGFSRGF